MKTQLESTSKDQKDKPLLRVMVADKYTYETDLPVQVGDRVRLPCGDHAKDKTWVAKVTALTSHYTGPCKRIIGFASEQD